MGKRDMDSSVLLHKERCHMLFNAILNKTTPEYLEIKSKATLRNVESS